jgi:hypothetical protein
MDVRRTDVRRIEMKQQFSWGERFLCPGWVLLLGLILLFCAFPLLGQNQQQAPKAIGSSDITAMLESAKSTKLKGNSSLIKQCNKIFSEGEWDTGRACTLAHTEPFDQLQHLGSDDISQLELALLRACAFGSDKMGPRNPCGELGGFYEARGDLDMAMAVYQQAPECVHPHHDEFALGNGALLNNVMHWAGPHCLGGQWRVTSKKGDLAGERVVVSALCSTYNLPDACSRFNELGGQADLRVVQAAHEANVAQAEAESVAQNEAQNEHNREASARRQESDARFSETINSLSNPNAIVDAGNQQAAAIRSAGDANAAQQQAAAQERAAAQRSAQQTLSNRSSNAANSASQTAGAVLPTGHTPAPLTVRFGTVSGYQGNAHVVSTPPGIDCPSTCSFQFGENAAVMLFAAADQSSAVKGLSCSMSSGTGILRAGNSMSCSIPQWAYEGGPVTVYVDIYPPPGTNSSGSNGQGANGTRSGGNGNSSGGGSSGTSGGNSGAYLAPIAQSCVREFWNPKFYNWLSFENDCGQAINLTWIAKSPSDHFGAANANIAPGQSTNTGWSQTEVAAKGGFTLFICPAGSVAVDGNTRQMVSSPNATYSCKKQSLAAASDDCR